MSTTVLPWHREVEKSVIQWFQGNPEFADISAIVARHDPHAAQHAKLLVESVGVHTAAEWGLAEKVMRLQEQVEQHDETVRLLEEALHHLNYSDNEAAHPAMSRIRAHFVAIKHHAGGANGMMNPTPLTPANR